MSPTHAVNSLFEMMTNFYVISLVLPGDKRCWGDGGSFQIVVVIVVGALQGQVVLPFLLVPVGGCGGLEVVRGGLVLHQSHLVGCHRHEGGGDTPEGTRRVSLGSQTALAAIQVPGQVTNRNISR